LGQTLLASKGIDASAVAHFKLLGLQTDVTMDGVVNVHQFSRRRLFVLIFGGEDGFLSKREEMIAATWLGMLAERMWRDAGQRSPRIAWFLALSFSYSDSDFQRLVLNEEAKRKQTAKKSAMPA